MDEPPASTQLLQQRARNGIMDYLALAASADEQREYERRVSIANVPDEVINQWEDWVREDDLGWYAPPVFSHEESEAIRRFHDVWDGVADETPNPMPDSIDLLIGTPAWNRLMAAAQVALDVFLKGGRFDQDVEARFDK
jgi:hypothetical protein